MTRTVFVLGPVLALLLFGFGVPADAQRAAEGTAHQSVGALAAFPALTRIYRFTGLVTTSRAANTGLQVAAHCTNWAPSGSINVRFDVHDFNGALVATSTIALPGRNTRTYSTQTTALFFDDSVVVPMGIIHQGSLEIFATGAQVHCSAQLVNAASTSAAGVVTLAATRNNQEGGAQE